MVRSYLFSFFLLSFHPVELELTTSLSSSLPSPFSPTAQDYVEGMWRMLQQDEPEDFVLATGETHPIKEYIEKAFKVAEIELR